ncbi:MAG: type II toxin-antitoxin system Phd/YefM family antitoxin [Burkholderiales bacterium]
MKRATISQAKDRLSEYLQLVERGETVLILRRDKPIARIVPVETSEGTDKERLADLERRGIIRRASKPPRKTLPPPIDWPAGVSLLDALLRDRDEARY